MASPQEIVTQPATNWLERFKTQYDLAKIPEIVRDDFDDFITYRAGSRDYYLAFPTERFDEGIGKGDSPRKELLHQIGHSRLRIEGLQTGTIPNWQYGNVHPEEHAILTQMTREALIGELDKTTEDLYLLYTEPDTASKIVQLPYGKTMTGTRLLRKAVAHESGHEFMGIKLGDYFNTPRPASVIQGWG